MFHSPSAHVFEQWQSARTRLLDAIQSYALACTALDNYCSSFPTSGSAVEPPFLQSIYLAAAEHLKTPELVNSNLPSTPIILKKLRNCSSDIVPISRLPNELLSHVFILVVNSDRAISYLVPFKNRTVDFVNTISSVCTSWRRLALGTATLWTHIDVCRDGLLHHTELWSTRAQDALLSFKVLAASGYSPNTPAIVSFLAANSTRLQSLTLRLELESMRASLCAWLLKGAPSLFKSLSIYVDGQGGSAFPESAAATAEQSLKVVQELDLHNVYFDWTSSVFHNLTDLRLSSIPTTGIPTMRQLVDVLCASPGLHVLQVSNFAAEMLPGGGLSPMKLKKLEVLRLRACENVSFWCCIISLLQPGASALGVHFSNRLEHDQSDELIYSLSELFQRSNVHTLYMDNGDCCAWPPLSSIRESLPNLGTLALRNVTLEDDTLTRMTELDQTSSPPLDLFPRLHTLDLESCMVMHATQLTAMLQKHLRPIRKLRITHSRFCYPGAPSTRSQEVARDMFQDVEGLEFSEKEGSFVVLAPIFG